ncbi:MAG: hypothetical protein NVSMB29_04530 [Candidatus Dormibacteria bacterium]
MNRLARHVASLPPTWKWDALFVPPVGFDPEWREWLADAQRAEQATTLQYWARRASHA